MKSIINSGIRNVYIGGNDKTGLKLRPGEKIDFMANMDVPIFVSHTHTFINILYRLGLIDTTLDYDVRVMELS